MYRENGRFAYRLSPSDGSCQGSGKGAKLAERRVHYQDMVQTALLAFLENGRFLLPPCHPPRISVAAANALVAMQD